MLPGRNAPGQSPLRPAPWRGLPTRGSTLQVARQDRALPGVPTQSAYPGREVSAVAETGQGGCGQGWHQAAAVHLGSEEVQGEGIPGLCTVSWLGDQGDLSSIFCVFL